MENVWTRAALCVGLAPIATLSSIWLKISTAPTEIVVGTVAQLAISAVAGSATLGRGRSGLDSAACRLSNGW